MPNRPLTPFALTFFLLFTSVVAHPLDPLSKAEISTVVPLLRQLGRIDEASRFSLITLYSPPKP